jgi:hypothetical protein
MTYRIRGKLARRGRYIIAGKLSLQRGKEAVLTPRGTHVTPDAQPQTTTQPPACAPCGGRPVPNTQEDA